MPDRTQWRAEFRSMLQLAWPVVLAELGWMLQGIVDVMMVGRLGPVAIGSVALGNVLFYAPSLFGLGLMMGLDTVVSHAYGRGDYDACHRWLAQAVYIALVATPLLMFVAFCVGLGLPHFGVAKELIAPTLTYLHVLLLSTLPLLLYAAARRYLQAVGEVRVITLTFLAANLLNWAGNEVLIYGHFGIPAMGVAGSALSTVFSRIVMAASLFAFAWRYERKRGHPLFEHWARPVMREIRELLRLGLPAAGQFVLEVGAFGATAVLAGTLSPVALAAHEIALNYAALAFMVPLGISSAASIAVGHAVGAKDWQKARRSGMFSLLLGICFMMLVSLTFLSVPRALVSMYTHDAAVTRTALPLFVTAAAFAVFDGIQIVSSGALRGLGDTKTALWSHLCSYYIVGLPLGALLCFHFHLGVLGLWIGLTCALITASVVLLSAWLRRAAKTPAEAGALP
ncbi:MATE family efflux transporter [Terriglobus sp. ADX1]|uniref:MATE family efflux transporter n=1 Tax=Terriglobus sp. ADX1 TaxID=2794063 RepID=UPI002FE56569